MISLDYISSFLDAKIIFSMSSLFAALAATVMVSFWASSNEGGYLGKLDFSKTIFALHPIMMVGGFLFSQIAACELWHLTKSSSIFSIFQTLSATSLAVGLIIAFRSHTEEKAHLTSLHSWYGMATSSLYILNLFIAIAKMLLKKLHKKLVLKFLHSIHPFIGILSIAATVISISTGIVSYLGDEFCSIPAFGWNPLHEYEALPDACKLANGLGIVVITAIFLSISRLFLEVSSNNNEGLRSLDYNSGLKADPLVVVTGKSQRTHVCTPQTDN